MSGTTSHNVLDSGMWMSDLTPIITTDPQLLKSTLLMGGTSLISHLVHLKLLLAIP